jgi:hypothetical protein
MAWALWPTGVHHDGTPPLSLPESVSSSKTRRNPDRVGRHAAMLLVTQQPLLGGVGLEAVHQFVWAARGVPAVDLVVAPAKAET